MGDLKRASGPVTVISARCRALVGLGALICAVSVIVLALLVSSGSNSFLRADRHLVHAAADFTRSHQGIKLLLMVWQVVFYPAVLYLLATPITVFVWKRGHRNQAVWGAGTMLCGWLLGVVAKFLVHRARPELADSVAHASGFSYPSGHVLNATLMLTVCFAMTRPFLPGGHVRALLGAGTIALVALTALDRVFLAVHYPSDVIAGVLLGLAVVGASYASFTAPKR